MWALGGIANLMASRNNRRRALLARREVDGDENGVKENEGRGVGAVGEGRREGEGQGLADWVYTVLSNSDRVVTDRQVLCLVVGLNNIILSRYDRII